MTTRKARLEIDDETEANVIQTTDPDGRTSTRSSFKAKAIADDSDDENEILGGANSNQFAETETFEEIPKTRLERLFDDLREQIPAQNIPDNFFANVVRQPDEINSRFIRPCNNEIELGVFTFTTRDQFSFVEAIQRRNNQSGGIFNITIYKANRQPLRRPVANMYSTHTEMETAPIGVTNFYVPDPIIETETEVSGGNGMALMMGELRRMQDDFNTTLREIMQNKRDEKREPTALERALEQKIINEIANPTPPPAASENSFEKAMAQMILLPQMADRFSKHMFPDAPTAPVEREPDLIDKMDKFGESRAGQMILPLLGNMVERFSETAQAFAVSKMKLDDETAPDHTDFQHGRGAAMNPASQEKTEMQELIEIVITEVESERALDGSNETIRRLLEDYPAQAEQLAVTCQTLPFDNVFALLVNQSTKMQPSPFAPFVDVEASQKAGGKFIWNERGLKAMKRLETFHGYLRTIA